MLVHRQPPDTSLIQYQRYDFAIPGRQRIDHCARMGAEYVGKIVCFECLDVIGVFGWQAKSLRNEGDKNTEPLTVTFFYERTSFDFKSAPCLICQNESFDTVLL